MFELARWSTRLVDGARRTQLELPIRVAGYDVDYAGIVNNAVYIRWLEDLRTIFMARWLSVEQAIARGESPVLTRIAIDYRAPLRLGDTVVGRCWVSSLARATAVIETEVERGDGTLCAHALQTFAWIQLKSGRAVRLPKELLAAMAAS